MIYCDTSLLISALTTEPKSNESQAWIGRQPAGTLAISPWVDTEFASAIALKGRTGDLDQGERSRVLTIWRGLAAQLHIEPILSGDFARASDIVGQPNCDLRGGDALHLAVAKRRGFDLATLDHALADYALVSGLVVHRVFEQD